MNSIPKEFQINYEENFIKEYDERIFDETMNKLNSLFEEQIDLNNCIKENVDNQERVEDSKIFDKIEKKKSQDNNDIQDKRRKKAIYELLKYYKKANVDKSLKFKLSPFRRLIKPKKIQMNGRILLNKQ